MEDIFRYFAVDWLAMLCTMLAIWQIGNKRRIGFVVMIAGNLAWVMVGVIAASHAIVFANLVFIVMNVRALIKWSVAREGAA